MLIVSYDISDDKLRGKFAKFLMSYAIRLQYSVYEIKNSERILSIITTEIEHRFQKDFSGADSIIIFNTKEKDQIRYGNAKHQNADLLIL